MVEIFLTVVLYFILYYIYSRIKPQKTFSAVKVLWKVVEKLYCSIQTCIRTRAKNIVWVRRLNIVFTNVSPFLIEAKLFGVARK